MSSILMQRMSMSHLLGKMFGGKRDLYDVFGYDKDLTYEKAVARYRRQDVASRIVDAPADALWSNPPKITSDSPEWNSIWEDLTVNKGLWNAIGRVDRMAGLGTFSVLLIGMDQTSSLETSAAISSGSSLRKVIYLQPYPYNSVEIKKLVQDSADPRYLRPELYQIKPSLVDQPTVRAGILSRGLTVAPFNVHHTRILHVAENYLTDEIFGNSRIERVWNLLDDLLKVAGGTAETFWLISNRGIQVDVDKEMELTPQDEKDLTDEVEEYIHQLRRFIRTRGVKINALGSDVPDPRNVFDMLLSLISGATGIPKRILLGSEAGQLASGQDRNNWAERIEERRTNFGAPVVIWPLIRMLTNANVLPSSDSLKITVEWPDAFKLTPLERGQTSAQKARSAVNLAKAIDVNSSLVSLDEAREILELDVLPQTVSSDILAEE